MSASIGDKVQRLRALHDGPRAFAMGGLRAAAEEARSGTFGYVDRL